MTPQYGFEIDFLPVGNGDCSGDAIALRYGIPGDLKIMVYDGGTKESGEQLVEHIQKYYGSSFVDHVVCSHPDADHASGLSVILEKMDVGELWMHRPWAYSKVILDYFKDGRITDESLVARLQETMGAAYKLEELAMERNIPIYEPFHGEQIGDFIVMSPERDWYIHELIPAFDKSPEQKSSGAVMQITRQMTEAARKVVNWVTERWHQEFLREDEETSAENESSVVLYGKLDVQGVLLTGDAGIKALSSVADFVEGQGYDMPNQIDFVQMPHHGSRHNVSTSVLDRLIGPRKPDDDGINIKAAFASAGKESTSHPRQMVINAFRRRGCKVFSTKGNTLCHRHNMPARPGWTSATELPFSSNVESWD